MDIIGEQPSEIKTKPRNGFIAFILSLIFPGLGQIYNGQPKKAILFFGLVLLVPLLFGITRATTLFYGLVALYAIKITLRIYIAVDGVMHARRQKKYVLKPYNTWYYYLFIALGIYACLIAFDSNSILRTQAIKIPTLSNNPTIQVGDYLVADMRAYSNHEPDYGDIVVFSAGDEQTNTFRIVGLPNDEIELIENSVSVNGKSSKETFITETMNNGIPVLEYQEELLNGHKHLIYKFKHHYKNQRNNIRNIAVPEGCYYVLGDNRDNAADSRYEGFITRDQIKGRILYIYWGQTIQRINIDLTDK